MNTEFNASVFGSIAVCTIGYLGSLTISGLAIKNKAGTAKYTLLYAATAAVTMLGYKWAERLREEA